MSNTRVTQELCCSEITSAISLFSLTKRVHLWGHLQVMHKLHMKQDRAGSRTQQQRCVCLEVFLLAVPSS